VRLAQGGHPLLAWEKAIRKNSGLWRGNTALLESCGGKRAHPDRAA
jgi:hypothetical protein